MWKGPNKITPANFAVFCLWWLTNVPLIGQFGGHQSFQFLSLPASARIAASGGVNVSSKDGDAQMFISNPALLDSTMHQHAALTYQSLLADIKYGSLSYVRKLQVSGVWGLGVNHLDYGEFQGFDPSGAPTGVFNGSETAITLAYARPAGPFTLGASLRSIFSGIAGFNAVAVAIDVGGTYIDPNGDLVVGLVFKNAGVILEDFTTTSNSSLPFDVQLGVTFKPAHMPFRFTFTGYNIGLADQKLFDPSGDGLGIPQELSTIDRILRHLAVGTEILVSKNFNLRAGYNHLIRNELRLSQASGGAGFSFGFLLRIKRFELAYTRSLYHPAGGYNYFTLASDLNSFIK